MAQVTVIGWVTADPEQKISQNNNSYVRFDLAENITSKDRPITQYYQVWAFGENAARLAKSKVKKGSLISVTGNLFLDSYIKSDGITTDKALRVNLNDWGFIPTRKRREESTTLPETPSIDGDKEPLPE